MGVGASSSLRRNAQLKRTTFDKIPTEDTNQFYTLNVRGRVIGLHPLTPNSAMFLVSFDNPDQFQVLTPGNTVESDKNFTMAYLCRILGSDGSAGKTAYFEIAEDKKQLGYGSIPPVTSLSQSALNRSTGQGTATDVSTPVIIARPSRTRAYVRNLDNANNLYIGSAPTTLAGFVLLPASEPFLIQDQLAVNAVCDAGLTAKFSFWEEYN